MKRWFKRSLAAVLVLLVLSPFLLCTTVHMGNDRAAQRVAKNIAAVPLPADTRLAETFSRAGKLVGNGNGMQYFGAVLLQSEAGLDALQAHYAPYGFTVQAQTAQKIEVIEHGGGSFAADVTESGWYIVFDFGEGGGPFAELDLRGH